MSEISSGLVAFCYMSDRYEVALFSEPPTDPLYDDMFPVVRLSDAESMIAEKNAAIDRLEREASACDLLEEQKGTITALNMALGGEDSTSTENLIDSHDIDYNDEGLISLCRKLIAENIRLGDKLESTGCSPISEEVEDILRSENQRLKSQNQMLIERVDSWTRDAQTLNRQIEEYRQDSQTTADALGHIQQQFELANQDRDDWIACHAKVFRELQETKALVGKQAERIKELEAHTTTLEEVIASQRENVTSLATEVVDKDAEIERLKQTPTIEEAKTTVEHLRAYASDNGYSHGDYADVMTEAANQIEKQSERIKELEAEVLEQCRLNGMGAERELALLGQIERQSAALKLAKDALELCDVGDCSIAPMVMPSFDAVAVDKALAAIDALGENNAITHS